MRFHNENVACRYENRLSKSGYPGKLWDAVVFELQGGKTLIDVGAGTGFFAVPLALAGYHVVAVEPSAKMLEILKGKLEPSVSDRISLHQCTWESWEGTPSDILICIHAIYPMKEPLRALQKMSRHAKRSIVVVRADEGIHTLSQVLRNHFKGGRCGVTGFKDIKAILTELSLPYRIREVAESRETVIEDIEAEAAYYCEHLGLDKRLRTEVVEMIFAHTVPDGARRLFRERHRDMVMIF